MQLFVILLAIVSISLLLIKLLGSFTGSLSQRIVSSHFQSAEALLERDRLPSDWRGRLEGFAKRGTNRQPPPLVPGVKAGKRYLMKKIHGLHNFFEKCPFVESAEARDLLLSEIDAVINRWDKSDLPEILRYYGVSVDN